MKEEYNVPRL